MNNPCRQIFIPGDRAIITYCLEYPELTGKVGIVTNTQETGYNFDMLWLTIDGEEYMFFSDEIMLVDDSGPQKD